MKVYLTTSSAQPSLQSRYKTFKLLKSEIDCQPVC